jgi:hypothetical protein
MDNQDTAQLESQLSDKTDLLTLFERRYNEEHQRALQFELNNIKHERTIKQLMDQIHKLQALSALAAVPASAE